MFFEHEGAPYHCLDVDVSKPTARGGQTLVRIKMRNLLTRAVFDKTFKAGDKFKEPDLERRDRVLHLLGCLGFNFMNQETCETITLSQEVVGDDGKAARRQRRGRDSALQRPARSACSFRRTWSWQ